jgi:nucleoside-diphosphate-sugar epimerase
VIAHWSASVGETFHAVSPAAITLRGYAEAMAAWFGRKPNLRFLPWAEWKGGRTELEAEQTYDHIAHSSNCSIAKAERMLGYRPGYSSIDAVCESVSWLIEKGIVRVEPKAV